MQDQGRNFNIFIELSSLNPLSEAGMGLAECPSAVSSPPSTSSSTGKGGYRSLAICGGVIMHSPAAGGCHIAGGPARCG